jgi:DNA-binding HxlR family transcriptional regulator
VEYGQFCPIAKATEILGEKWTILIVRELLMGARRFSELQRGLTLISPTLLSKRLDALEQHGLLIKRRITGQKGHEYLTTPSCQELLPILVSLGEWGMRWAQANVTRDDYDVELLMLYLQRSIRPAALPGRETAIRFHFTDIRKYPDWWLLVQDEHVDICVNDPGREIDVYFTTTVKAMADVWMGKISYRKAIADKELTLVGQQALINDVSAWMSDSIFAGIEAASAG